METNKEINKHSDTNKQQNKLRVKQTRKTKRKNKPCSSSHRREQHKLRPSSALPELPTSSCRSSATSNFKFQDFHFRIIESNSGV